MLSGLYNHAGDCMLGRTYKAVHPKDKGRVANPKTSRVTQPITEAADATGRDRSWICNAPKVNHIDIGISVYVKLKIL